MINMFIKCIEVHRKRFSLRCWRLQRRGQSVPTHTAHTVSYITNNHRVSAVSQGLWVIFDRETGGVEVKY